MNVLLQDVHIHMTELQKTIQLHHGKTMEMEHTVEHVQNVDM